MVDKNVDFYVSKMSSHYSFLVHGQNFAASQEKREREERREEKWP